MKKQIALAVITLMAVAGSAFADVTLIFNDVNAGGGTSTSGSYAAGQSFTFDVTLNYTGSPPTDLFGITLYFRSLLNGTPTGGIFTITGVNRNTSAQAPNQGPSPFTDAQSNSFPQPMNRNPDGSVGGADNQFDLGAGLPQGTANGFTASGNYFLMSITFQVTGSVTEGQVYTIQNVFAPIGTSGAGHGTVAFNRTGTGANSMYDVPSSTYTVTIIPEPGTWSLIALGGLVCAGVTAMRRRRS